MNVGSPGNLNQFNNNDFNNYFDMQSKMKRNDNNGHRTTRPQGMHDLYGKDMRSPQNGNKIPMGTVLDTKFSVAQIKKNIENQYSGQVSARNDGRRTTTNPIRSTTDLNGNHNVYPNDIAIRDIDNNPKSS